MPKETEQLESADIMRIMELLPHRYPFLMVDRIIDINRDISATGIKNVSINEPFFAGHFPSRPVMPGVLLVEAMAQTAGCMIINQLDAEVAGRLVYFMAIDKARFRRPVTPGDTVRIPVELVQRRANVCKFRGEARVDGQLVAEADFSAMIANS